MHSWNTASVCDWKLFWFQADGDEQHPVPVSCPSWGSGWSDEASAALPGVGTGDALRLHISPPPASAAPCWHTGHCGGGRAHSRAWGGDHTGRWLQTLPGTLRYTQVHPSTPSNEAFISDKSQSEKRIALKKNVSLRGFNPSSCAPLILCSSRCWHLVQLRPYQHCVLFLSLIKGPVRGSVWCWWTMTPSGTFQTCWLYRERSSSARLAALSSWSTGTKELKVSEKSWTTSERDPTATTSSQSSSLWQRSSTRRKRDDGKI